MSSVSGDAIEFRFPAMAIPLEEGNFMEFSAELDMTSDFQLSDIQFEHDSIWKDGRKAILKKKFRTTLTDDLIIRIQV